VIGVHMEIPMNVMSAGLSDSIFNWSVKRHVDELAPDHVRVPCYVRSIVHVKPVSHRRVRGNVTR